jgi:hypothetical protein
MPNQTKTLTLGGDISSLDIFLSDAGGVAVQANHVGFELLDAANSVVVSGIATNPATGQYAASGVIPSLLQTVNPGTPVALGTWKVNWDIITAANTFQAATELFCVQEVTVKIGFTPSTDKTFNIYDAIRVDLGADDNMFDDGFLGRVTTKAVRRMNHRLGLSVTNRPKGIPGTFGSRRLKVSPITLDLSAGTIEPNNDEICDLVIMQCEVILLESEINALKRLAASGSGPFAASVASASQDGISVTNADGVRVDISGGRLANRVQLYKFSAKTARDELEASIKAFLGRQTGNYSKLVY